jgi:hypothetical protein
MILHVLSPNVDIEEEIDMAFHIVISLFILFLNTETFYEDF